MADEVHWKENTVGPPNDARQEPDVLHFTAIVMQECPPAALDERTELGNDAGFPSDIEERLICERDAWPDSYAIAFQSLGDRSP